MTNNDWYRYYAPRRVAGLTPEEIAVGLAAAGRDLDFVLGRTGLQREQRLLEIGCGWGRHAIALAQRGFAQVASVEIAPQWLEVARPLAAERGQRCDFRLQDFMQVQDGPYAAILSLYDRSCCGFPSEEQDLCSLSHLARLLSAGGWLVFGINDWPFALPEPSQRWAETEEGVELLSVLPDRAAMTCTDQVVLLRPSGRRELYQLTRRHYYLPELRKLLAAAGLRLCEAYHRLDASRPYGDGGDGLFVFARRALEGA